MNDRISTKSQARIRSSNIELLRIFCILAIIADHFIGQSGIIEMSSLPLVLCYYAGSSLSRVACSVFVIISSWFLVDGRFKFSRIIHTWLTVFMFTIPFTIFMICKGLATRENLAAALLPIDRSPLWFASCYIILVLLSPALNLLIHKASCKVYTWILFALLTMLTLYSTVTAAAGYLAHDVWVMILIYLITGYIKYYGFTFIGGKRKFEPRAGICFICFLIVWIPMVFVRSYADYNVESGLYIWVVLREYADAFRAELQTLPNLIMAFSLFFGFKAINIKPSRILNKLASTTLGVYCFHQIPVWYLYLWSNVLKAPMHASVLHGKKRVLYTFLAIIAIWFAGSILELVRSWISSVLIEKRKFTVQLCARIDALVNDIGCENSPHSEVNDKTSPLNPEDYKFYRRAALIILGFFVISKMVSLQYCWYVPICPEHDMVNTGELNLTLSGSLDYVNSSAVQGFVQVRNNGKALKDISNCKYPLYLGISVLDSEGNVVDRDYLHLPIMREGVLDSDEETTVEVLLDDETICEYVDSGCDIRVEVVQEGIGWDDSTAIYFDFD